LDAVYHHTQLVFGQFDPVAGEQFGGFVLGEREIRGPDLHQRAGHPQPVQPQGGVGPGQQHQPQPRWSLLDEGAQ
jgi:hypothetical protein